MFVDIPQFMSNREPGIAVVGYGSGKPGGCMLTILYLLFLASFSLLVVMLLLLAGHSDNAGRGGVLLCA